MKRLLMFNCTSECWPEMLFMPWFGMESRSSGTEPTVLLVGVGLRCLLFCHDRRWQDAQSCQQRCQTSQKFSFFTNKQGKQMGGR